MKYAFSCTDIFYHTSADTFTYTIRLDKGEAIYFGTAIKAPGERYIDINVSRIVSQYLDVNMPDFREFSNNVTLHGNGCLDFKLYQVSFNEVTVDGQTTKVAEETLVETYRFLYGFDYSETWDGLERVLSNPINGVLDPRMKLFYTAYYPNASGVTLTSVCGVTGSTPTTGSTPSWDSGATPDTPVSYSFTLLGGNGVRFNSTTGIWVLDYATNYPSIYYVFSGATGVQTGFTNSNSISFYIPANTGATRTWNVQFYPEMGGVVLTGATATQTDSASDSAYTFSFTNAEGAVLSATTTANNVGWTTTYPSIAYSVYRNGELIESGQTSLSEKRVYFPENTDTDSAVTYSFKATYMGQTVGTLTWTQAKAAQGGGGEPGDPCDNPTSGPMVFKVKPTGWRPASNQLGNNQSATATTVTSGVMAEWTNSVGTFLYGRTVDTQTVDGWDCITISMAGGEIYDYGDNDMGGGNIYPHYDIHYLAPDNLCGNLVGDHYRPGYNQSFRPTKSGYHATHVIVPDGINILGYNGLGVNNKYTFPSTLTYLKLPCTLTEIREYVFSDCVNITSIDYGGTREQWDNIRAYNAFTGSTIEVIHCTDGDVYL